MRNPVEMTLFWNPLQPATDPALQGSTDEPGSTTGEDDSGNLDEIDQDKNIAGQVLPKLFEKRQDNPHKQDRVDWFPVDWLLPGLDNSSQMRQRSMA